MIQKNSHISAQESQRNFVVHFTYHLRMENLQSTKRRMINRMLNRYGKYVCENCRDRICDNNPEFHHIVHRHMIPHRDDRDREENLMIVCKKCHVWLHDHTEGQEEEARIIEERLLKYLFQLPETYRNKPRLYEKKKEKEKKAKQKLQEERGEGIFKRSKNLCILSS